MKTRIIFVILLLPTLLLSEIYTFKSMVKQVEEKDKNSVIDFLDLLVNFISKTKYNKSAEEFHDFLSKSLEKFEFKDLYHSKYMKPSANGYRSVTYAGVNSNDGFLVDLIDSSFEKIPLKGLGDFRVEYSLRKNESSSVATGSYAKSNSYSGDLKLEQNFGVFSHEKGVVLLSSLLSVLDIENLSKLNLETSKTFPNLKESENRKLLDLISNELPSVNRFLNQYFSCDSILKEVLLNKKRVTAMNLKGRINNRYVQNKYPFLAGYLDDISSLGWIHFVFYNSTGNKIFELRLESSTLLLHLKLYTYSGKIIPYLTKNGKDELDLANSFSLKDLNSYLFKIQISFKGEIYGLNFENKNIWVNGSYSRKQGVGNINFTLKEVPRTTVSGGFSYLIPAWAIDLVIPGNMQELIYHFTTVLVHANQEKGSFLNLSWKKNSASWLFSARSEAEFVDNFFIRFGLKVFNFKIRPSKEAEEELSRFLVQILELGKNDLTNAEY